MCAKKSKGLGRVDFTLQSNVQLRHYTSPLVRSWQSSNLAGLAGWQVVVGLLLAGVELVDGG